MKTSLVIIVLCNLSFVHYSMCSEGVKYTLKRMDCSNFNKKFVYNISCYVRPFNRTAQLASMEVILHPNVSINNLTIECTSYMKFGTVYRPSVLKFSENVCDALKNTTKSHILHALRTSYAKYTNYLEPCPKTGKLYVKDMLVDWTNFPKFVPIGEYRVHSDLISYMNGEKELIYSGRDYVAVQPLGAIQF